MSCAICLQGLAEARARVLGAVGRCVARRVRCLCSIFTASKASLRRRAQQGVGSLRVLLLERRGHHLARPAGADAELRQLSDGQGGRGALQRARELRRQRDGAERRGALVLAVVQIAVEPAVLRALDARRPALHVVLRVEVRARLVGRSAGVHDGELAALEQRREWRHARVQAEEAVEVDALRRLASGSGNRDRRPALVVGRSPNGTTMFRPSTAPRWKIATRIFWRASAACAVRAMNAGANPRLTRARLPFLRKTRRFIITTLL